MSSTKSRAALVLGIVLLAGCGSQSAREPPSSKAPAPFYLKLDHSPGAAPALEAYQAERYFDAANLATALLARAPTDVIAHYVYAAALIQLGDWERARKHLSFVLAWQPRVEELYPMRALCAAVMGDPSRARQDMAIARQLEPKDSRGNQKRVAEQIENALNNVSNKSAPDLSERLFEAAHRGKKWEKIQAIADELVKAANNGRRCGDETYSERCRLYDWSIAERPNDPDRLFRFARFLLDEAEVQEFQVESPLHKLYMRFQNRQVRDAELGRARMLLAQALQLDPNHRSSLIGMARLEYKFGRYGNMEKYVYQAMPLGDPDPEMLYLMRNALALSSGTHYAAALALRQPEKWTERYGHVVYEYTRYPSAEDYRRANAHDRSLENMMQRSVDYRNRILRMYPKDARTHDYIGTLAYEYGDYKAAARSWENALEYDPDNLQINVSLANAYARLNRVDDYLRQATRSWAPRHTTAAFYIQWAGNKIRQSRWTEAETALREAMAIDAADPRTLAYRGIIEEAKGASQRARSYYKSAIALEEAKAKLRGASYLLGTGRWYPNEIGLVLELRMRLALLYEETSSHDALAQYAGIYNIESKINDIALKEPIFSAMLPVPGSPSGTQPRQPLFGELTRTSRVLAGYLLYQNGQYGEAAAQFKELRKYDNRLRAAGAKPYEYLRDTVWKSKPVVDAALDTFTRVNDQSELRWWAREARSYFPPVKGDWRRNTPQETPHWKRGGKLRIKG